MRVSKVIPTDEEVAEERRKAMKGKSAEAKDAAAQEAVAQREKARADVQSDYDRKRGKR